MDISENYEEEEDNYEDDEVEQLDGDMYDSHANLQG